MGVPGLWKLLAAAGLPMCGLGALRGKRLAVDASVWLVRYSAGVSAHGGESSAPGSHLGGLLRGLCLLRYAGALPVLVFDGPPSLLKRAELARRSERRRRSDQSTLRSRARALLAKRLRGDPLLGGQEDEEGQTDVDPTESLEEDEDLSSEVVEGGGFLPEEDVEDRRTAELVARAEEVRSGREQSAEEFSRRQLASLVKLGDLAKEAKEQRQEQLGARPDGDIVLDRLAASDQTLQLTLVRERVTEERVSDSDPRGEKTSDVGAEEDSLEIDTRDEGAGLKARVLFDSIFDLPQDSQASQPTGVREVSVDVSSPGLQLAQNVDAVRAETEDRCAISSVDVDVPQLLEQRPTPCPVSTIVECKSTPSVAVSDAVSLEVDGSVVALTSGTTGTHQMAPTTVTTTSTEVLPTGAAGSRPAVPNEAIDISDEEDPLMWLHAQEREERLTKESECDRLESEIHQKQVASSVPVFGEAGGPVREIVADFEQLARLFGVPWLQAPSEADAQCAFLNAAGLVDGVVTDDSDAFLFGASHVYRDLVWYDSEPRAFRVEDLPFTRDQLLQIALLAGCDYCEGVGRVGCARAAQIVRVIEGGLDGLSQFRAWAEDGDDRQGGDTGDDIAAKLAKVAHTFHFPPGWPGKEVFDVFVRPLVNDSTEPFGWAPAPDVPGLLAFMEKKAGWPPEKTERLLQPLVSAIVDPDSTTH